MSSPASLAAPPDADAIETVVRAACARVAPLWPLERFVAVNPYVGLADLTFEDAAARLAAAGGVRTTMPVAYYLDLVDTGRIGTDDLAAALAAAGPATTADSAAVAEFLAGAHRMAHDEPEPPRVVTVADIATRRLGEDWGRLMVDRVSAWASVHFDEGQVLWKPPVSADGSYAAWRADASLDRTPEIMGLRGFRSRVAAIPPRAQDARVHAFVALGLTPERAEPYLHALLLRIAGWAGLAARIAFERALAGVDDDTLPELLTVMLAWEAALFDSAPDAGLAEAWHEALATDDQLDPSPGAHSALTSALVLQAAFDRASQRELADACAARAAAPVPTPAPVSVPEVQAVFCIDVRSEVLRRRLEAAAPGIETLGFAGFFGVPLAYRPLAHEAAVPQCPVLLAPSLTVPEVLPTAEATEAAVASRRLTHHVRRAWKSFKMGAVSCFSFVGPVGLAYLPKLLTDSHGVTRPVPDPHAEGLVASDAARLHPDVSGVPLAERVAIAEGALRGMSLTRGFAPLVLIAGHGSSSVNNPYAAGLDCGACGGHAGLPNARIAAAILDDHEVRADLATRGIVIPNETWFLAALHDTTDDSVTLLDVELVPESMRSRVEQLTQWLAIAGSAARVERAPKLGIAGEADVDALVARRGRDWAQVRPEWGLAGCRAFVAAPRALTAGIDLGGRVFLHSYDWRADDDFSVLESIMTAPVVVASWISLQYYASTVDSERFGAGDKTLHNVVGRLGVLEGNGGDLRVGLPLQSVHDGQRFVHEPLRLTVVLAAPTDAIDGVLARNAHVRDLVEHGWVQLAAMDDAGQLSHRYERSAGWEPVRTLAARLSRAS